MERRTIYLSFIFLVLSRQCLKFGFLFRSLGVEWGQYGIRMNCIAPGPIYTEGAFSRLDPSGTMINQAVKAIPTGRLGEVEEIANLATYMCRYVLCALGRPVQFFLE